MAYRTLTVIVYFWKNIERKRFVKTVFKNCVAKKGV